MRAKKKNKKRSSFSGFQRELISEDIDHPKVKTSRTAPASSRPLSRAEIEVSGKTQARKIMEKKRSARIEEAER